MSLLGLFKKTKKPDNDIIQKVAENKQQFDKDIIQAGNLRGSVPISELAALLDFIKKSYIRDTNMMSEETNRNTFHYGDLYGSSHTYAEIRRKLITLIKKNGSTYGTRRNNRGSKKK